ncbi:kinesin-like protein KIN-12B isoform X2 [Morus notabilis]|uniref:kinesin-like protein KIN-12B isoform X2 n=1 Tax=Morus notabilis TaxID=981085 RepID=UPI000CED78A2|nr:kinesin-like protein KIN-12B isoform X2 [Morus notabilis]
MSPTVSLLQRLHFPSLSFLCVLLHFHSKTLSVSLSSSLSLSSVFSLFVSLDLAAMKHFMQPRNAILRETTIVSPASPHPSAAKARPSRKQRGSKDNAPPSDPSSLPPIPERSPAISAAKLKSPLPPRPLSSNPLKKKLSMQTVPEHSVIGTCESGVQFKSFSQRLEDVDVDVY